MNPFPLLKVLLASVLTLLFSWVVPHKAAVTLHNTPTPFPTRSISPVISVTPPSDQTDTSFLYPGATVVDNPDGSKTLTSTDDPNKITQWYKDQISVTGMHSTSVSQTNSNNNILNVLDTSSNVLEINIAISRPAEEKLTTITLREKQK